VASISPDGSLIIDGLDSGQRVAVVEANDDSLIKDGAVLMRFRTGSARPRPVDADLETETLESSNASALTGMTSLVQAAREFEMVTKVIDAFSNIEHRTAQEVGRSK
jgi:flagellar basal body rod protein FlgG